MNDVLEDPATVAARSAPREPGHLVVVRTGVVENADHVFGNLFQRLYAGVGRLQALEPVEGELLASSVRELEEALQLVLDYVAPFPPVFERFSVGEVAESLAQRLKGIAGLPVAMMVEVAAGSGVLADPSRLGRAFDLLAMRFGECAAGQAAEVSFEIGRDAILARLQCPPPAGATRSSIGDLRWAVAEKLIELHGGSLEMMERDGGGLLWTISLPHEA